jgi:hypothetical protein
MPTFFRSDGWVKTSQGPAVPGAQVFVCTQPANAPTTLVPVGPTPLAPIYSDPNGLVAITQPIISDGFGHYDFYATAGSYTVLVYLNGTLQQVYPDQSVGGVGSGGGTGLVAGPGISIFGSEISCTFSQPSFETNGVANTDQALLNLIAGAGISLASDGSGGVTISATGGGSGALSVTSAAAPSTLNVSTEGTKDWLVNTSTNSVASGDDTVWHWKLLGGYLRRTIRYTYPSATVTNPSLTSSMSVSADAGDDASQSNVLYSALPLSSATGHSGAQSNNTASFTDWGFSIEAPADTVSRTLTLYVGLQGTNGTTVTFTARLSDGSAVDAVTTVANSEFDLVYYKVAFTFKSASAGQRLNVTALVTTSGAASNILFGLQAATLF